MKTTRALLTGLLALALAGSAVAALQSPAEAAVTASTITKPANGTRWVIKDSSPETNVPLQGTTNGNPGDVVDFRCYSIGSSDWKNGPQNVVLGASGSFSTTVPTDVAYGSCRLRAVPDNYAEGASLAAFNGPTVTSEWVISDKITAGPNAGKTYDYYVAFQGARALNDFASATGPGLWDTRLSYAGGFSSNYLWYGNGALRSAEAGRLRLKVDGRNAYGPRSAESYFPNNAGLPGLTWSATRDTKTGLVTIKESNPIVFCPKTATTFPPTAEQCYKFVPSGIRLERTIIVKDGGLVTHISDTWRSVDGKSHLISPWYVQYIEGYDNALDAEVPVGLKLPWLGKYTTYTAPDTYAGPSSRPASLYVRTNNNAADGNTLFPRGALTFDFATTVSRADNGEFTLRGATFKVPPGGTKLTRQSFAIGTTESGITAKAKANEARLD